MTRAVTAKYEELVVEVEFTPESGTYVAVCGIMDATVNRNSNIDTSEVPDCDDESLPLEVQREVRSQEVTISGSGVWALSSHENMLDWWYSAATLNARVRNAKASADGSVGDTYLEAGAALLSQLNNGRTKGQKVSAEIQVEFDGLPTRTPVTSS